MNRLWKYWCKAMGSHAYDDDKKDDHIHLNDKNILVSITYSNVLVYNYR